MTRRTVGRLNNWPKRFIWRSGELRDEYRQAFVLFHEHELCYAEIAEAMEVPLGTIKTWVHRARRELIDALRKRGSDSGE